MPMSVTVTIEKDTVVRDLRAFRRELGRVIPREIDRSTRVMLSDIRAGLPRQSGELAGSYYRVAGKWLGIVGTKLFRARFAEFGTSRGQRGNHIVRLALRKEAPRFRSRIQRGAVRAAR